MIPPIFNVSTMVVSAPMKSTSTISGLVLIVDDTPANLDVISETLHEVGLEVAIATSGERALRQLRGYIPDLILLDVMMPGIDGFETCRRLKQDERLCHVPVMFMTSLADQESKIQALELGAVDYITKPFCKEEVLARVKTHVQLFQLTQKLEEKVALKTAELRESQLQLLNNEARIRRMAYEDYLTQLPNRAFLQERLEESLNQLRQKSQKGALLLIDLDHFKTINDALGHNVGDAVLKAIAERLRRIITRDNLVARLGGDEFVILLTEMTLGTIDFKEQVQSFAQQVMEQLLNPILIGDRAFSVGASIGIAFFPEHTETTLDILRHADIALYRAKNSGRGRTQFYFPSFQMAATRRLQLEEGLRKAIANDELQLYFQPQVDHLQTMVGAEVLLRWQHPEEGLIPPDLFIPVAEETGLIHSIGQWVFEKSCEHLSAWLAAGIPFQGHLSINVSPWQFARPDFMPQLNQVIQSHQNCVSQLMIELTETAILYDLEETITKLNQLRSQGIKIALDDFGTGYSSLAHLKKLPIDVVKIDKLFVQEIDLNANDCLVQSIISIGQLMALDVIAEGVETEAQYQRLKQLGCQKFQGYFYGRPLSETNFLDWIAHQNLKDPKLA